MKQIEGYEWLSDIDTISLEDGITYCGTEPIFIKFLTTFRRTLEDKANEIENAYKTGDIEFYTIKVHALKSTSRMFGDMTLSNLALKLEEAGKVGDIDTINAETGKLLEMYRAYKEKLAPLVEN